MSFELIRDKFLLKWNRLSDEKKREYLAAVRKKKIHNGREYIVALYEEITGEKVEFEGEDDILRILAGCPANYDYIQSIYDRIDESLRREWCRLAEGSIRKWASLARCWARQEMKKREKT